MAEAGPRPMAIVIKDQIGDVIHFQIKTSTPLEKVFVAYCAKKSLERHLVKFVYEGLRVKPEETPEELKMEDNDIIDIIDCFVEQQGGSSASYAWHY